MADVGTAEEGKRTMGTTVNVAYRLIVCWWLMVLFSGFGVALGGLAALQRFVNRGPGNSTYWWSIPANYPDLTNSHVLRWDWFVLFFQLVLFCMVCIAVFSTGMLQRARLAMVGLLAAGAVLACISTDRLYNVRAFRDYSAATAGFAGFLLAALADFCLVYMLGIDPSP